jgi:hypothetical protein
MQIFNLTHRHALGPDIAQAASFPLAALEKRNFNGGQHKTRPLVVPLLHAQEGLPVHLLATQAFCDVPAVKGVLDPAITSLIGTNPARSIEPADPMQAARLRRLSVAPMIGRCLGRMPSGRAISPTLKQRGLIEDWRADVPVPRQSDKNRPRAPQH